MSTDGEFYCPPPGKPHVRHWGEPKCPLSPTRTGRGTGHDGLKWPQPRSRSLQSVASPIERRLTVVPDEQHPAVVPNERRSSVALDDRRPSDITD